MRVAVDNLDLPDHAEDLLWDYLLMAANSMVNSVDDPDGAAAQTVGTAPPSGHGLTIDPAAPGESGR